MSQKNLSEESQAFQYEIDPNNKQKAWLRKCCKLKTVVYNMALRACLDRFENNDEDRFWGMGELQKAWRRIRDTSEQLQELDDGVPSHVANYACMNVLQALKNWWGTNSEKPKEKRGISWSWKTSGYKVSEKKVRLPNLGWIRTKERIRIRGNTKSATIRRLSNGKWKISFTVERDREVKHSGGPMVGIDLGLSKYVTLSNGQQIEPPKPYVKAEKRLNRWNRKLSRKEKGSNNYKKLQKKINKLQGRISNQRKDFIHKLTTALAKTYGVIAIEDLATENMARNKHLSKGIYDAGWGIFKAQLEYKTNWYGCKLIMVDRWFPSTKTCCRCGNKKDIPLSQRTYRCEECGLELDRDVNAAVNIEKQIGIACPEFENASGESPLRASMALDGITGKNSVASTNEEVGILDEHESKTGNTKSVPTSTE